MINMKLLKQSIAILSIAYVISLFLVVATLSFEIVALLGSIIGYVVTALFIAYLVLRFVFRYEDASTGVSDRLALLGGAVCSFLTIMTFI